MLLFFCLFAQFPFLLIGGNVNELALSLKPLLKEEPFSEIVTLGSMCLPKFRVKSFLGKNMQKNLRNGNYLFDWMFILNYTLLAKAISNNLTGVFDQQSLVVKPQRFYDKNYEIFLNQVYKKAFSPETRSKNRDRPSGLYNEKYDFFFNHVYDHMRGVHLTPELFNRTYASFHSKFVYLIHQSLNAFRNPRKTLYLSYVYTEQHQQSDFVTLMNSIKAQRGNNNFLLLVLVIETLKPSNTYAFDLIIDGNLCFHEIKFYAYPEWFSAASIQQWDNILSLFLSNGRV